MSWRASNTSPHRLSLTLFHARELLDNDDSSEANLQLHLILRVLRPGGIAVVRSGVWGFAEDGEWLFSFVHWRLDY